MRWPAGRRLRRGPGRSLRPCGRGRPRAVGRARRRRPSPWPSPPRGPGPRTPPSGSALRPGGRPRPWPGASSTPGGRSRGWPRSSSPPRSRGRDSARCAWTTRPPPAVRRRAGPAPAPGDDPWPGPVSRTGSPPPSPSSPPAGAARRPPRSRPAGGSRPCRPARQRCRYSRIPPGPPRLLLPSTAARIARPRVAVVDSQPLWTGRLQVTLPASSRRARSVDPFSRRSGPRFSRCCRRLGADPGAAR